MGNKQAGPCVDANGKTLDSVEEEEVVLFLKHENAIFDLLDL